MQDHAKHGLIKQFALHWPRNIENLEEIEDVAGHKSGNAALPRLAPGRSGRRV